MKNVLIPTDLTLESLYPVHEICRNAVNRECNIYIIHTMAMPSGIMDLLFMQETKLYSMIQPQFMEALEMLKKKYASVINTFTFEFVWSNSKGFLKNYMHARDVHTVYLLNRHHYKGGFAQSVKCIPTLLACRVPVVYVQKTHKPEHGLLTTLLYREDKRNPQLTEQPSSIHLNYLKDVTQEKYSI
jgi:hypothetical protein